MFKRVFILLAITSAFLYAQVPHPVNYDKSGKPDNDKDSSVVSSGRNNKYEFGPEMTAKPALDKISFSIAKSLNSPFKETPVQLDTKDLYYTQREPPTKLTKLALSQMLFAGMGVVDYAIKEAPMYPGYRRDTFFWRSAWGGIIWGTSAGLNILVVKDFKYLLGMLTEDMSYYLCRQVFHKQNFPAQFGLPVRLFGADQVPMKAVLILWAASVTYLALDALDIF
jgi:hypothetical protein